MFCESCWFWNATPMTAPSSSSAGPPELPGLIAASIWIARSETPEWAYRWISMRETTPCVIETPSPPSGYPTTLTSSCRHGIAPNAKGSTPSQKRASSTWSVARSHSCASFCRVATYFRASPALRTSTYVASATTCAFVRMHIEPLCMIEKPEPVDSSCWRTAHGIIGCWPQCTLYTFTTGSADDATSRSRSAVDDASRATRSGRPYTSVSSAVGSGGASPGSSVAIIEWWRRNCGGGRPRRRPRHASVGAVSVIAAGRCRE